MRASIKLLWTWKWRNLILEEKKTSWEFSYITQRGTANFVLPAEKRPHPLPRHCPCPHYEIRPGFCLPPYSLGWKAPLPEENHKVRDSRIQTSIPKFPDIPKTFGQIFCETKIPSVLKVLTSGANLTAFHKQNTSPTVRHGDSNVMVCGCSAALEQRLAKLYTNSNIQMLPSTKKSWKRVSGPCTHTPVSPLNGKTDIH